jgi:hypothetical protein
MKHGLFLCSARCVDLRSAQFTARDLRLPRRGQRKRESAPTRLSLCLRTSLNWVRSYGNKRTRLVPGQVVHPSHRAINRQRHDEVKARICRSSCFGDSAQSAPHGKLRCLWNGARHSELERYRLHRRPLILGHEVDVPARRPLIQMSNKRSDLIGVLRAKPRKLHFGRSLCRRLGIAAGLQPSPEARRLIRKRAGCGGRAAFQWDISDEMWKSCLQAEGVMP